jgi:hypothetical protein
MYLICNFSISNKYPVINQVINQIINQTFNKMVNHMIVKKANNHQLKYTLLKAYLMIIKPLFDQMVIISLLPDLVIGGPSSGFVSTFNIFLLFSGSQI